MMGAHHPKQHGLFVLHFVEYANSKLAPESHESTDALVCLLFIRITSHPLFKWINVLFKAWRGKKKEHTAAVNTATEHWCLLNISLITKSS